MIRFFRPWVLPLLFCTVTFLVGFIGFQPGWKKVEPLTDGSGASFQQTAKRIHEEDLLKNAAPRERVRWLLELCAQPSGLARDHALYEAIQHMQPGDFLTAFADLPTLGQKLAAMNGEVRFALIQASMERWLEVDREGALRMLALVRGIVELDAVKLPPMGGGDLGTAYEVLAMREPEWFHEQIDKLGEKTGRETAMNVLMSADAARDPKKAREWLETFRGSKEWNTMFSAYVNGLAASDPRGAFQMVISDQNVPPENRSNLLSTLTMRFAAKSPSLVGEMLGKIEPEKARTLTMLAAASIGQSGGDSIAWLADRAAADPELLAVNGKSPSAADGIVWALVQHDPVGALEFIASLPDDRQPALRAAAITKWGESHPDTLIDWLATQPPDVGLKNPHALDAAALRRPDHFADWVATLPAGEMRDRSELALVDSLVRRGGAQEALAHFPPHATDDESVQAARKLGGVIGAEDPSAGARWVATLPVGLAQAEAAWGLAGAWGARAPQAAAQWIEGLPLGGA
ncbi:MAG: hypothetical protein ABI680_05165, partial [Chthoniobacteraceae bacterium]